MVLCKPNVRSGMIIRMGRIEAIAKLRRHAQAIRAMGATSLYVFGSTVRDEERAARDLDLFIDYDPNGRFNAFDLVGIKQYLEDELKLPVDVTTRDGLHPTLRAEIEQTAVRVF
jgi:uncharacterized protein